MKQDRSEKITFAVVSDPHVGRPECCLDRAVELCNSLPLDFVLLPGDLIQEVRKELADELIGLLGKFTAPFYLALGNHEAAPDALDAGLNPEKWIQDGLPGPWNESFTYAFQCKGWRFVVAGGIRHFKSPLANFYINGIKGHVDRGGHIMYLEPEHRDRLCGLLAENTGKPTCLVTHASLSPTSLRLLGRGAMDQVRLIEELQLRSVVEAASDVKVVMAGHQHYNQVEAIRGQLHCVTQDLNGTESCSEGPAFRIVEMSGASVKGRLIWEDRNEAAFAPPGTSEGDLSFSWSFA